MAELPELRRAEYDRRRAAEALRAHVFTGDASAADVDALSAAEEALAGAEQERAAAERKDTTRDGVIAAERQLNVLGEGSTGLVATLEIRMAQVPTSIYHLLKAQDDALVQGTIENRSTAPVRRVRVTTVVDGYSVPAVDTYEIPKNAPPAKVRHLPTLLPDRISGLDEVTRATVTVLVEDIGGPDGTHPPDQPVIELHRSQPVWLLARTSVPFTVKDPGTETWRDLSRYFGAFVTPNDPAVMAFLRTAATRHPDKQLVGYQVGNAGVEEQVKAVYDALRQDAGITYINSVIAFSPEDGTTGIQRVRRPAESLADHEANCIDGVVLMASILEAASLNAGIVVIKGHSFLAWQPQASVDAWDYVETTMLGSAEFAPAHDRGRQVAQALEPAATAANDPTIFRRWPVRELRAQGIMPIA
jgi:hypothetical protein